MLSYEDCVGLCELTEDEIRAIAEHEHVPEIVAAELGYHLLQQSGGARRIKRIILDDFAAARARGDWARAQIWRAAFRRFVRAHPSHPRAPGWAGAAAPPKAYGFPDAERPADLKQSQTPSAEIRVPAASQTPPQARSVGNG